MFLEPSSTATALSFVEISNANAVFHKRVSFVPDLIDLEPDNPGQVRLARARSLRILEGTEPDVAMSSIPESGAAEKGKDKVVEGHTDVENSELSPENLAREAQRLSIAAEERRASINKAKIPAQLIEVLRAHTPERILNRAPIASDAPTNWNWTPGGYNDNFKVDPNKPEYGWPVDGGTQPKKNEVGQWVEAVITPAAVKWYELVYNHVKYYIFEKEYKDVPGWSPSVIGYGNGKFKLEIFHGYPLRHLLHNLALCDYTTEEEKKVLARYNRCYSRAVGDAKSGYQISAEYLINWHLDDLIYDIERILNRPFLEATNRMDEYDLALPLRLAEDKVNDAKEKKDLMAKRAGMTTGERVKELAPDTHALAETMMGIDGRPIKVAQPIIAPGTTRAERRAAEKQKKKILKKATQPLPGGFEVFKGGEAIVDGRITKVNQGDSDDKDKKSNT